MFIQNQDSDDLCIDDISDEKLLLMIKIFNLIYRQKNITATAKILKMSKSSISKYLSTLEKLYNQKFFIRKGRNGMEITDEGEKFYIQYTKIIEQNFQLFKKNSSIAQNIIKICIHPLSFKKYILPILKTMQNYNIEIIENGLNKAIQKLRMNIVDAIFFPIDTTLLSKFEEDFEMIKICKYNLCLYFNKKHIYAQKKEKDFTWKMLKTCNICPMNIKFSHEPFYSILHHTNDNTITTSTSNMNTLYYGVKENLWVLSCGEEIECYYDCSDFTKKKSKKNYMFDASIFWFFIYKKQNKQKLNIFVQKLKSIVK